MHMHKQNLRLPPLYGEMHEHHGVPRLIMLHASRASKVLEGVKDRYANTK